MNSIFNFRARFALGALPLVLLFAGGCCLQAGVLGWFGGDLPATASRAGRGTISADAKKIEVENRFGEVKVIVADQDSPGWTWKAQAWAKTDDLAKATASQMRVDVETNGESLQLVVVFPDEKRNRRFKSDLEIHAPKSCAIRARNGFGPTSIMGVDGPVEARCELGSLEVRRIRGEVTAQTSFARLKVSDCGPARLKDQNGEIETANIRGPLEVETSFARLSARNVLGPINARNQNGAVTVAGVKGRAEIRTSFAEMIVTDIEGPLKAHNQNGAVTATRVGGAAEIETSFSPLVVDGVEGDAVLSNQNGSVEARAVSGSIRAGTSFAPMRIEGSGRNFVCHNQNGLISLASASPELSRIEARTSFSPLQLRLPAAIKPAIQAHTSFGSIESDFPVIMKAKGQNAFASVESGVPQVVLENQNGSINIRSEN